MTETRTGRVAAQTWFLARGLPSVLTDRARWRRRWQRSAPALPRGERFNVVLFVLGLLVLSQPIVADWTKQAAAQGTMLGMTLPVPQPLILVTMFIGAHPSAGVP